MFLGGCATNQHQQDKTNSDEPYTVKSSFLKSDGNDQLKTTGDNIEPEQSNNVVGFQRLESIQSETNTEKNFVQMSQRFSTTEKVTLAADNMPVPEFLHYVFGELLGANYVLGQDLKKGTKPLTINIQEPISKRQVFDLVAELLAKNQISIDYNENVFFIQESELGKAKAVIGIGNSIDSIPQTTGDILQVIPIKYGIRITLERTIRQLIDGNIRADYDQGALFVLADRANVLRAIELVNMLDVPANRGKFIGLISLTYIGVDLLIEKLPTLLKNEGISASDGERTDKVVSLVPLNNIGAIAVFTSAEDILRRVNYWVAVLDKPIQGDNQRYFVYNPRYARATDLGTSIGQLLSIGGNRTVQTNRNNSASTGNSADNLRSEDVNTSQTVSGADASFVVDERSNSIIFNTTGSQYKKLEPLLQKLDVLPKQVILEVMLAEVTMEGGFKFGIEFALDQNSDLTLSTLGAFGAGTTGGINLSYLANDSELAASFFRQNRYVNVLSNPTLLVRDGVKASIKVGESIPITDSTIVSDNGTQTTSQSYRETGVSLQVTPTINAQGVVIMEIEQEISNEVTDSTDGDAGNPAVFERELKTEVVVESGQTVILAGLISERINNTDSGVPFFADIPLLGNLFKGKDDNSSKTELVMLVTPKVIYNNDQWRKLIQGFENGLDNIEISF